MGDFSERRCRMLSHLADSWWHLNQEGSTAPQDITTMLEHRIRDVLRDGDCPACAEIALAQQLDKAVET